MSAATEPIWLVTAEKVDAVVQRLIEVARPRKIILFGSFIRGEVHRDSDLDIMVIVGDEVTNPRQESVHLRSSLRGINMPMDIVVVPESFFEQMREKIGLIYREAWLTGKVVYESQS